MRRSLRSLTLLAPWGAALLAACSGGSSGEPSLNDAGTTGTTSEDASAPPPSIPKLLVGGTASGLRAALVLEETKTGQTANVTANGPFGFAGFEPDDEYAVGVRTAPPGQTCSVARGTGTVGTTDVSDIEVTCAEQAFSLGGTVSGLSGTISLDDDHGHTLSVTADGAFTFPTALPDGASYAVRVTSQPASQRCTVTNGAGKIAGAAVTSVSIACAAAYTVSGSVSGLVAGSVVLQLDGESGPGTIFSADGAFTFPLRVVPGAAYAVTVLRSPPGQTCAVTAKGSGIMPAGDLTGVTVACRKLAVVLNEFHAKPATGVLGDTNGDGTRSTTGDAFIEVMNTEAFAVDVGTWTLKTGAMPTRRFAFPQGTTIPAGGRAVVFGGPTPTGSFGGSATFTASLGLTGVPSAPLTVELAAGNDLTLDSTTYDNTTFGSCTTSCASQVRSPEGTGAFVGHATASGSAGILWSPGVAATAAIPKLSEPNSTPRNGALSVTVTAQPSAQFNMWMTASDLASPTLRLFASPCNALANEVASTYVVGAAPHEVTLLPNADLAYGTVHCLSAAAGVRSANGTPLGAAANVEFTTRTATSAPAATVVLSEVGAVRFTNSTSGGVLANDEFVELYNPTANPVAIEGWFIQRRTASGSRSCWATLPVGASVPARGYYLVGGPGYTASRYANTPAADFIDATGTTLLAGANESVVLMDATAASCTASTATAVVDAVSYGAITERYAALQLPALSATIANGTAIERKACFDSAAGAGGKGLGAGGGHVSDGNSERFGASNADWVARAVPGPQNTASGTETRSCP